MALRTQIKLEELLRKHGITQTQLADSIGVRRATINDLYHNRSKQIPRSVIDKIANELNIKDINELITLIDE
ncbi:helix-turn-helix domain-containing protein [Sediminibacillus massiliensis]|uniref:helix-turn-helix domain-containing protein n=1 Tax=Sediminibacillus massiliensis TaxID=1926277 RepID=UPI0009884279|nr:helix-turn-helix transcriptional regulator [Sediminibacillus massiliensis]